jgi:hypothetical protein
MKTVFRVAIFVLAACLIAVAQDAPSAFEREYDHPADDVRQALQSLRAQDSRRLSTVYGFVTNNLAIGTYDRPYYEFESEIVPRNAERTMLRVKARITAYYSDPAHSMQEYRTLTSNGRLEREFLERVGAYLVRADADLDGHLMSLHKMVDDLTAKTDTLQKQRDDLVAQNKRLEDVLQSQAQDPDYVTVTRSGTEVLDHPASGSHTLISTQRDDLFEVVFQRQGWVEVKVGPSSNGWLPESNVKKLPNESQTALQDALKDKPASFVVTREMITSFMGDWTSLQGKKALFLWAQPVGLSHRDTKEKLGYAKSVFADRYRQAVHSEVEYSGLVIIFLGPEQNSGVAAARLDDIGLWLDGRMPESEFLHRCSLDLPGSSRASK